MWLSTRYSESQGWGISRLYRHQDRTFITRCLVMLYLQGQLRKTPDAREHHAELHNSGGSNRLRGSVAAASTISYPREFLPNEV